jgi:hypothetical protein
MGICGKPWCGDWLFLSREERGRVSVDWRNCVRGVWAGACLVVVAAACGAGSLTLSEYAAVSEELATEAIGRLETLDAEWESQDPTVEGARAYWEGRVEARVAFLEGIEALNPPDEFAEIHATALDLFGRLVAAEEALADRVSTLEVVAEHGAWWDTPEGQAVLAVDEEAIAICQAGQAQFNATGGRETLSETPWIPSQLKEAVRVAFGCPD